MESACISARHDQPTECISSCALPMPSLTYLESRGHLFTFAKVEAVSLLLMLPAARQTRSYSRHVFPSDRHPTLGIEKILISLPQYWEFMLHSQFANVSSEKSGRGAHVTISRKGQCFKWRLYHSTEYTLQVQPLPAVESLCMELVLLPRSEQPPTQ